MNTTTESVISTLNEALEADPSAIRALLAVRVNCNSKLADHPTIVVGNEPPTVSVLGLLNGIVEAATGDRIAAVVDDESGNLQSFVLYTKIERSKKVE